MDINQACEAFRILLEEQRKRIANMNTEKTDFTAKKCVTIGIVDGDGIGPYITAHATRVLEKLLADEIAAGSIVLKQIEGLTIENRKAQGKAIPDDVMEQLKACTGTEIPKNLADLRNKEEKHKGCIPKDEMLSFVKGL